ncbi:MarR family transcriptional regulator [Oceanivirga salmonicida]|uniref:MarR family transcriptional regulator n=1 Tax=Oceanivirga salmonicida TaxID=1769291 RepID=UPI000833E682|nr:MarR family transcriptional regulator [Oceanivirga salmonicida]
MIEDIEKLIYEFYKLYYKIEQLSLDNTIRCLTQNEIHVINLIGNSSLTMNELCDKLGTTLGTTSIAINKLEKKNFVKRQKDKKDKRKVYVSLSLKGNMAYKFHGNFHRHVIEKATKKISKKDIQIFYNTFKTIKENLEQLKKEYEPILLPDLEIDDIVQIEEIKLSHAAFKYLNEKGIIIGKEIKLLEKDKTTITVETIKGIKVITLEDALGIHCIKKGK